MEVKHLEAYIEYLKSIEGPTPALKNYIAGKEMELQDKKQEEENAEVRNTR